MWSETVKIFRNFLKTRVQNSSIQGVINLRTLLWHHRLSWFPRLCQRLLKTTLRGLRSTDRSFAKNIFIFALLCFNFYCCSSLRPRWTELPKTLSKSFQLWTRRIFIYSNVNVKNNVTEEKWREACEDAAYNIVQPAPREVSHTGLDFSRTSSVLNFMNDNEM